MLICAFPITFKQPLPITEPLSEKYCSVLDWRLKVVKGPSHLGLFLVCEGDSTLVANKDAATWSCQVAATLTLHNHVCKKKSISRVISHKFTNKSLDWGFAKFAPLDSLTASKGFLDKEGDIQATVRVVADFPTYKTLNMPTGSNKKGKRTARRDCKKEKSPEEEDVKDTASIIYGIIVEVLDEVVAWGCGDYSEDGLSSSSEGSEVSDGDSENSESSENISDGELEWLARDLREFLALPEKKSVRMEMGSKTRFGRRILKEGLGQVQ